MLSMGAAEYICVMDDDIYLDDAYVLRDVLAVADRATQHAALGPKRSDPLA
jgi:hypothetical protein